MERFLYAGNKSETDATQAHGIEDVVMPVYYRCTASVLNVRSNPGVGHSRGRAH